MGRSKLEYCELPKDAKLVPNTDRYFADPLGNIYSRYKNGKCIKMHTCINLKTGYLFCSAGYVHRLVAETFFGKIEGMDVNHKNGNKADNSISNLEWCTHKENMQHAWKNGLNKITEETKRKISEALRGKTLSEDTKRKMSKPVKVIFNDNTELVFNSRNECADFLKVHSNHLSVYILGKEKIPKKYNIKEIYYL